MKQKATTYNANSINLHYSTWRLDRHFNRQIVKIF